jgi:hypothetical protein
LLRWVEAAGAITATAHTCRRRRSAMAVHGLIHSVADGTGRTDAEIKALVGAAVVTTAVIALLRAIDTLSQARPFRPPRARLPRLTLALAA